MEDYLFRIDMAADNDRFMELNRDTVSGMYAGIDLRIGSNWAPDFVRLTVDDDGGVFLTIIELEARAVSARISGRKYLPEDPTPIVQAFDAYLGRVIDSCRSSADPRERVFRDLRVRLRGSAAVTIHAAGALRSSREYVEKHPLLYQTDSRPVFRQKKPTQDTASSLPLNDRLSSKEVKWLFRTIAVLDAVVRGKDHSNAMYRAWRAQEKSQPLKYFLRRNGEEYPKLSEFVFSAKRRGAEIPLEPILSELTMLWSAHLERSLTVEVVRQLIQSYSAESLSIQGHERMPEVFEAARAIVANSDI
jgi:hypothetical protein